MYNYVCVKEQTSDNEIGKYTTYGIKAYLGRNVMGYVPDISLDYDAVEQMARLFNKVQLDAVHLIDAITDSLP